MVFANIILVKNEVLKLLSTYFVINFRGGVSELQFNQVLNNELDQIIEVWATSKFFQ